MFYGILPPQGGTYSADMDALLHLITYLMLFGFVASLLVIIYLVATGMRKPGVKAKYVTGETKKELSFVYATLALFVLFDLVIDVQTHAVWANIKENLPAAEVKVRAIGQQWAWTFVTPGKDGQIGTEDDISSVNELHLPAGKITHVELESSDVLHSFSVPIFRLKQDVIPGRIITSWFQSKSFSEVKAMKEEMNAKAGGSELMGADTAGSASFDIQCAEMCGVGHGIMAAKIVLHSDEDYSNWVSANSPVVEAEPMAEEEATTEETTVTE